MPKQFLFFRASAGTLDLYYVILGAIQIVISGSMLKIVDMLGILGKILCPAHSVFLCESTLTEDSLASDKQILVSGSACESRTGIKSKKENCTTCV